VALALVTVIAVAALAAALFLLRARNDLRRQLAASARDAARLGERLTRATAEGDELRDKQQWLTASNTRIVAEVETQRERADELAVRLAAATATATGTATAGARADDHDEPDGSPGRAAEAGLWYLLLAHVTRRWASVVGVPPENRRVLDGPPADQLVQALVRETERLREEVGVDVELTVSPAASSGDGPHGDGAFGADQVAGRVAVLVAAVELLGVLATSAQRVTVDVGDVLVLTGDGWLDPAGELAGACELATAAGVVLDPVDVGDERVQLVVHATAGLGFRT
jgi:hypothetical protein